MNGINERIAILEERSDRHELSDSEILKEVKAIRADINRYKGFLGAIWFCVSCVGIFFSAFKFFHKG